MDAEDAGGNVPCECGASIKVPPLSRLRASAGLGAYETGAIDTIGRMLAEGTLPWGETCAASGRPTKDVLLVKVQCERLHVRDDATRLMFLMASCAGPLWASFLLGTRRQPEALGRETDVTIPRRLDRESHRDLASRWSKRELRRLLRDVPVYARLLDEYPRATIAATGTVKEKDDLLE